MRCPSWFLWHSCHTRIRCKFQWRTGHFFSLWWPWAQMLEVSWELKMFIWRQHGLLENRGRWSLAKSWNRTLPHGHFKNDIQEQVSSCNPRTGFIMHLAFLWVGYLAWSSCVLLLEFSNWKTQILFCATWDVWIRRFPTSGNIPEGFFWLAPDEFSSSLIILS